MFKQLAGVGRTREGGAARESSRILRFAWIVEALSAVESRHGSHCSHESRMQMEVVPNTQSSQHVIAASSQLPAQWHLPASALSTVRMSRVHCQEVEGAVRSELAGESDFSATRIHSGSI
jgi:hypothetical protein